MTPTDYSENLRSYLSILDMFKKRFFRHSDIFIRSKRHFYEANLREGYTPEQAEGFAEGSIWGGELEHAFKHLNDPVPMVPAELLMSDAATRKQALMMAKKSMPITQGHFGEPQDFIRRKNGNKVKDPFTRWERVLTTFEAWDKNGRKVDKELVIALGYWDRYGKDTQAYDHCNRDISTAIEFIRRTEIGTFPYNEKGEWVDDD